MGARWIRWGALGASVLLAATLLAGCQLFAGSPDFMVTTTTDGADAVPGDGVCEMTVGADDCSLRAAITEANASPVLASVTVPPATYALTVAGTENANAAGDLDVAPAAGSMVITAAGAGGFAIDADGAGNGLDLRSGSIALFGVGVSGASTDGVIVRPGAFGALTFASLHHNGGAGIRVAAAARAQLWNTTVSANGSGGVTNFGLTTTKFATITDNTGGGFSGVGDNSATAGITLDSSLVVDQASGADCADGALGTTFTTTGDGSSCGIGPGSNQTASPLLAPLTSDRLPIHPLLYPGAVEARDSIPVDSGSCVTGSSLLVDQRGSARPAGGACDRGAYEGPTPRSFAVTSALDEPDAVAGDGACASATAACTLRAAIDEANASPGHDTVTVQAGLSLSLTRTGSGEDANATGDLDVVDALTIEGNGSDLDAGGLDRAFDHRSTSDALEIHDLAIHDGDATGQARGGGAVWSRGPLRLEDVTLAGNGADDFGSVDHGGDATLYLTKVSVTGSTSDVAAIGAKAVELDHLSVDGSSSGGLRFEGGRVLSSTVRDNDGTGITVDGPSPYLVLYRSTVSGNQSAVPGGGVRVGAAALVDVTDSTLSHNVAPSGAALWIDPGSWANVSTSTIVEHGSAYPIVTGADRLTLTQSVVGNVNGPACQVTGTVTLSVTTDASCGTGPDDLVVADLGLGPLADNGGPTWTHLPEPGSPVVDRIAPDDAPSRCPGVADQRGVSRPQGVACDAGAVETEAVNDSDLVVDTSVDAADAEPGDGVCATAAGECSLRAAVTESNASAEVEVVTIAGGIDPTLSLAGRDEDANATGDLDITAPIVLDGGGATISGGAVDRLVDARAAVGVVVIRDLTLTGGDGSVSPGEGPGAIAAAGGLRLERVTLVDNVGSGAGAVGVTVAGSGETSRVEIRDSEVAHNAGGPAVVVDGGDLGIERSDVHDNPAGGVWMPDGWSLALTESTVRANQGIDGAGVSSSAATTTVTDSWIADNVATGLGGGLYVTRDLQLVRSTLSRNVAAEGGGLYDSFGTGQVEQTTVSGNSASSGAGISSWSASLYYSTVAGNTGGASLAGDHVQMLATIVAAGSGPSCSAPVWRGDYSLFGDASCGTGGTNRVGAPWLGPLQDNGGKTPTRLALPFGLARNAIATTAMPTLPVIPATFPVCPAFMAAVDQRGTSRPQGGACDIGATEG